MLTAFIDWLLSNGVHVIYSVLGLLPDMEYFDNGIVNPLLWESDNFFYASKWIAWLLPLDELMNIFYAWLGMIAAYNVFLLVYKFFRTFKG